MGHGAKIGAGLGVGAVVASIAALVGRGNKPPENTASDFPTQAPIILKDNSFPASAISDNSTASNAVPLVERTSSRETLNTDLQTGLRALVDALTATESNPEYTDLASKILARIDIRNQNAELIRELRDLLNKGEPLPAIKELQIAALSDQATPPDIVAFLLDPTLGDPRQCNPDAYCNGVDQSIVNSLVSYLQARGGKLLDQYTSSAIEPVSKNTYTVDPLAGPVIAFVNGLVGQGQSEKALALLEFFFLHPQFNSAPQGPHASAGYDRAVEDAATRAKESSVTEYFEKEVFIRVTHDIKDHTLPLSLALKMLQPGADLPDGTYRAYFRSVGASLIDTLTKQDGPARDALKGGILTKGHLLGLSEPANIIMFEITGRCKCFSILREIAESRESTVKEKALAIQTLLQHKAAKPGDFIALLEQEGHAAVNAKTEADTLHEEEHDTQTKRIDLALAIVSGIGSYLYSEEQSEVQDAQQILFSVISSHEYLPIVRIAALRQFQNLSQDKLVEVVPFLLSIPGRPDQDELVAVACTNILYDIAARDELNLASIGLNESSIARAAQNTDSFTVKFTFFRILRLLEFGEGSERNDSHPALAAYKTLYSGVKEDGTNLSQEEKDAALRVLESHANQHERNCSLAIRCGLKPQEIFHRVVPIQERTDRLAVHEIKWMVLDTDQVSALPAPHLQAAHLATTPIQAEWIATQRTLKESPSNLLAGLGMASSN